MYASGDNWAEDEDEDDTYVYIDLEIEEARLYLENWPPIHVSVYRHLRFAMMVGP